MFGLSENMIFNNSTLDFTQGEVVNKGFTNAPRTAIFPVKELMGDYDRDTLKLPVDRETESSKASDDAKQTSKPSDDFEHKDEYIDAI